MLGYQRSVVTLNRILLGKLHLCCCKQTSISQGPSTGRRHSFSFLIKYSSRRRPNCTMADVSEANLPQLCAMSDSTSGVTVPVQSIPDVAEPSISVSLTEHAVEAIEGQIESPELTMIDGEENAASGAGTAAPGGDGDVCAEAASSDVNMSRRMRRARRRGRLHKRQLELAGEEGVNEDAEVSKRLKTEDASDGVRNNHVETDFYIENGLRKIYPYRYTYLCYCKERWKGTSIIDMLNNEFMSGNPEFHKKQVDNGFVKVNGNEVKTGYMLKGKNELISNTLHRHELPITAQPVKLLVVDDDYVVVDKPASIPVHPCGRYRHNSLTFMLSREHGFHNLRTIYRLDRLTSGLLIFGRNHAATNRIMDCIKNRTVCKTYLSRVEGRFPDGVIECKLAMDKVHNKIGTWRVKVDGGKPCYTTFERVSYNGTSSVVKCSPRTGRTHQIRVHLQYLGHPIINDPLYNDDVWGVDRGKDGHYGKTVDQLYTDLVALHTMKFFENSPLEVLDDEATSPSSSSDLDPRLLPDPACDWCKKKYKDPSADSLVMYLHALSYKGPGWEYSTDEPEWAKENWKPAT